MKIKFSKICFGVWLSAVWIVLVALYCGLVVYYSDGTTTAFKPLEPNLLGDFLAGVSAPLAFLWLVLAVLVQKDELIASRKALMLQARELKLAVTEYSKQSKALMGAERLQRLQLAHTSLRNSIEILTSLAVDFLRQCASLDERFKNVEFGAPNQYGDQNVKFEGSSFLGEIERGRQFIQKDRIHKDFERDLELAIARQSNGDFSAVFAFACKSINEQKLKYALINFEDTISRDALLHSMKIYEDTIEDIKFDLEQIQAPHYMLRFLDEDHPGKLTNLMRRLAET